MRYSGRNTGSDCQFCDPFLSSRGSGVHANRKYRFKGLFIENSRLNRDLSLQFSGFRLVMFLGTCFWRVSVRKAAGSPLLPAPAITSENWGDSGFCRGFLVVVKIDVLFGSAYPDFPLKMVTVHLYDKMQEIRVYHSFCHSNTRAGKGVRIPPACFSGTSA